jgi:hypothetical protein
MNWYMFSAIIALFCTPLLATYYLTLWKLKQRRREEEQRKQRLGAGMAKLRGTWDIEYGDKPSQDRWKGYENTTTARMIAESHDEAVALLTEYDPSFNPQYIVKSQRGGLEYIVNEERAKRIQAVTEKRA